MLDFFEQEASTEERASLAKHFEVAEIHGQREAKHIVSSSLFWKPAYNEEIDLPELTREVFMNPSKHGIQTRSNQPWEQYAQPLIVGARNLQEKRPDVVFRVYLANDLQFLLPDLLEVGCEVCVMKSSSIRHNPGAMWRFLAMEHEGLVTITDADRANNALYDIERTELVEEGGLSHWRSGYIFNCSPETANNPGHYRPVLACHFGSANAYPIRFLCEALIWHSQRGSISTVAKLGESHLVPIQGTAWPTYGFDEWFLLAAVFPRMAFNGMLTFVSWNDTQLNQWFGLDIEYCTWANPKSEIMYHGDPIVDKAPKLLTPAAE